VVRGVGGGAVERLAAITFGKMTSTRRL
jgi:hypothetical protein